MQLYFSFSFRFPRMSPSFLIAGLKGEGLSVQNNVTLEWTFDWTRLGLKGFVWVCVTGILSPHRKYLTCQLLRADRKKFCKSPISSEFFFFSFFFLTRHLVPSFLPCFVHTRFRVDVKEAPTTQTSFQERKSREIHSSQLSKVTQANTSKQDGSNQ